MALEQAKTDGVVEINMENTDKISEVNTFGKVSKWLRDSRKQRRRREFVFRNMYNH